MIVPNRHELVTASEDVTRPDLPTGTATLREMTDTDLEHAAAHEKAKIFGFAAAASATTPQPTPPPG